MSDMLTKEKLDDIITRGMPKKQSFIKTMDYTIRKVGIKYLLFGMAHLITMVLLFFLFILSLLIITYINYDITSFFNDQQSINAFLVIVFFLSPLMYIVFSFIQAFEERNTSLFELKMTLCINYFTLIGMRMFLFGAVSILFNITSVIILAVPLGKSVVFASICVCACSVFIYSIILIYSILRTNTIWAYIVPTLIWLILGVLFAGINQITDINYISRVPIITYLLGTLILSITFYCSLKRLITRRKGDFKYATYKQCN